MPYVQSEKSSPPADDRKVIDAAVMPLAQEMAKRITNNLSVSDVYKTAFVKIAECLRELKVSGACTQTGPETELAKTLYSFDKKYNYEGAYLGEWNYASTMLIQIVPDIKVKNGEWKEALRYWSYNVAADGIMRAMIQTCEFGISSAGTFNDIEEEYKWEVNRPYEIIGAILKNGGCYNLTPYCNRVIELVTEDGTHVGYQEVMMKQSELTRQYDLLPVQIVVKTKK